VCYYNGCHGNVMKEFWALSYNIYKCMFLLLHCHCNAVKEFWKLRDDTDDCVITILDYPVINDGNLPVKLQFLCFFVFFSSFQINLS
jgi:hypothetical protein